MAKPTKRRGREQDERLVNELIRQASSDELISLQFGLVDGYLDETIDDAALSRLHKKASKVIRDRTDLSAARRAVFRDLEFYNRQTRRHPYINAGLYKTEADLTPDELVSLDKLLLEKARTARLLKPVGQSTSPRLEQINKEIHRLLEIQPPGG